MGNVANKAQKFLLDNNCGDLILNDTRAKNAKDRIYASDIMMKFLESERGQKVDTGERQSNIPDVKASALEKLKIAKKALNDIYNFDRDMEFEYGDPGERAMRALEAIDRIDGF